MMKRYAAIALVAAAFLAGCGGAQTVDQQGNPVNVAREKIFLYQGKPLHCLVFSDVYGGDSTCDFVRWHQENGTP